MKPTKLQLYRHVNKRVCYERNLLMEEVRFLTGEDTTSMRIRLSQASYEKYGTASYPKEEG